MVMLSNKHNPSLVVILKTINIFAGTGMENLSLNTFYQTAWNQTTPRSTTSVRGQTLPGFWSKILVANILKTIKGFARMFVMLWISAFHKSILLAVVPSIVPSLSLVLSSYIFPKAQVTSNKTEHKKNCPRKLCVFLCWILFEVTDAFGNVLSIFCSELDALAEDNFDWQETFLNAWDKVTTNGYGEGLVESQDQEAELKIWSMH